MTKITDEQKAIIDSNCLIAEFMGGEKDYALNRELTAKDQMFYWFYGGQGNWRMNKECRYQYFPAQLFYHTDYDWLLPVVEKIENDFGQLVKIEGYSCEITSACNENPHHSPFRIFKHCNTKIQAIWEAVVEFLNSEWFKKEENLRAYDDEQEVKINQQLS